MNDTDYTRKAAEIARFRFAIIAPVVQGLFPDASQTAYFKRVTEHPLVLPDGSSVKYSYKTPEKWAYLYRKGGLEALMPTERSDKGTSRVLSDEAIAEIYRIKEDLPRINATQIHRKLVQDCFIPSSVSVDAVQRFIRHNDLKSARNPNVRDRKAFEEDAFGKMWQADTCYLPHITEDGKSRRVYCVMIIDDHSRLLVGGGLFYNDNAYNFQKVLKEAIATHGIPHKLMVDNGSPYSNEQLSMICVALGVVLIHTRVRDGASKGKSLYDGFFYPHLFREALSLWRSFEKDADKIFTTARTFGGFPHLFLPRCVPPVRLQAVPSLRLPASGQLMEWRMSLSLPSLSARG
ncbi:MAG: DDE-type integrase/transposase/recombinase [Lachnospiraceae bacterium]|nr:DDE-type integrase/transposase/recombinase [Lachnospiraceae bacterium]